MLKLEKIMAAINEKLIEKYTDIEVNDNDVQKGFDRPSFFVTFDNLYKTDHLFTFERSLTIRIYYFPSDRYKYQLEVLQKQQEVEDLFKLGVTVEDRHLNIVDGIESEIVDGVLQVSFDFSYYEQQEKDDSEEEKMQELYLKGS